MVTLWETSQIPSNFIQEFLSKYCYIEHVSDHLESLEQRVARPRLEFRDREFYNLSLNIETETDTENVKVSISRPRPRLQISKLFRTRLIETLLATLH